MAECVFKNLEEMLPELEDFDRLGLFTPSETKKIIKRRTDYEYKLQKRIVEKKDFLKYMEYELNVDCLRRKRMAQMGVKRKQTTSGFAVSKRLHSLFQKSLRKFGSDVRLWMQYIDYCKKTDSLKLLGKSLGRLIQMHPHKPSVWILAAKWEFEENGNIENARSLMQRALRMNMESSKLWQEYFRLELLHVDKVKKRRNLLGIEGINLDPELAAVTDDFLENKTAYIVHNQAASHHHDDIDLRIGFASISREFDDTNDLRDAIYNRISLDFPCDEFAKHLIARRPVDELLHTQQRGGTTARDLDTDWPQAEKDVRRAYEASLKSLPTATMWQYYIGTFLELTEVSRCEAEACRRISAVLEIFPLAAKTQCLSVAMYMAWSRLLVNLDDVSSAVKCLQSAIKCHPSSHDLKFQHLVIRASASNVSWDELSQDFYALSSSVPLEANASVWDWWISLCCDKGQDEATQAFEAAIANSCESRRAVCTRYLTWCNETYGLKAARRFYKRFISSYKASCEFLRQCIAIEMSQDDLYTDKIRRLFEKAADEYGQHEIDVWLDMIKFETRNPSAAQTGSGVHGIYWRAIKQLDSQLVDQFIARHALLTASEDT